ncbi:hypothetical protein ACFLZR_00095, partial [Candidatus Neomarinimicrobiota bacterium]
MKFKTVSTAIILSLVSAFPLCASPQADQNGSSLRNQAINVYAAAFSRDLNYFREQMTFVNYVNTQSDADVVILFSRESTGSGGSAFTITFTGQRAFAGINDTLVIFDEPNDALAVQQERRVRAFKLALMRYVAHTPLASGIEITYSGPSQA